MAVNLDTNTRYSITQIAKSLANEKKKESKMLDRIAMDAEHASEKSIESMVIEFSGKAEKNFLEGKRLSNLTSISNDISSYDYKNVGTTENFPCTLAFDEGIWEFYLPPTPSVKIGKKGNNAGRFIGYLVKNLIDSYETEYGEIGYLEDPLIVFEFGFKIDDPLSRLYDADNRDNKRILDSMTGHFYPDDNILAIRTLHYGVMAQDEYTKVFVMKKIQLAGFLDKNSQW